MLKLSVRAWEILLVIDERSEAEPDGHFWVPGDTHGTSDYCERLGRFLNISGSGDARILKSLQDRGLTENPKGTWSKHNSRITEDGRLAIEQAIEQNAIPLELRL